MNKKISNLECIKLYKKIINLICKSDIGFFKLKKLKGVMGYCEWEDGIIIDYRKELVPTIIHECIHYLNPSWSETRVLYVEKRIVNCISTKQTLKLLRKFSEVCC